MEKVANVQVELAKVNEELAKLREERTRVDKKLEKAQKEEMLFAGRVEKGGMELNHKQGALNEARTQHLEVRVDAGQRILVRCTHKPSANQLLALDRSSTGTCTSSFAFCCAVLLWSLPMKPMSIPSANEHTLQPFRAPCLS